MDSLKEVIVKKNEYIIREGEEADLFYLVKSGRFWISNENVDFLKEIRRGDYFGESSLFLN